MSIVQGNSKSFEALVSSDLVLVDFFATWCGPCKMLAPVLDLMVKEDETLKIVEIDVDQEQELAMKYGVMSIPTLILFKNGHVVSQKLGFMPKELLLKWMEENK